MFRLVKLQLGHRMPIKVRECNFRFLYHVVANLPDPQFCCEVPKLLAA
jgi:hypothetical protein